jgi:putative membrane protein
MKPEEPAMMIGYGMLTGMGWLGTLTMVLFWAGVLALVVWGVGNLLPARPLAAEPDALAIVRQRFARGEISREEYLQAVETLR